MIIGGEIMVSLVRRLATATFAGLALATLFFLAGSAVVAAVGTMPAITPTACAAVGFTCAVGAALSDDLKAEEQKESPTK
jgi:hypothetical protein